MTIESRMPREEYDAIEATNISRLKELKHSPQHYRHAIEHPKESKALTLGTAAHIAVLEPERFAREFSVWDRKTETGRLAPRNGRWWDAFLASNAGKKIITEEEALLASAIAEAVRSDERAARYLASGDPEVSLTWHIDGRPCKGRVDWLTTIDGVPYIVGLKTARDCRHFAFGSQAAKLGYDLQWAWYHDGYDTIRNQKPRMLEIVVESEAPHAVAVYRIEDDILLQGRDNYLNLLRQLAECESADAWPGPVIGEEILSLPSWYYEIDESIEDLGFVA